MNDTNLAVARESSRHLADLLRREHVALADFLVALSEFDRAGAYRKLGYANVFDYLLRELKLSRGAAHYRKVAARLVARFPEVVEPLRDGRLCLSSLVPLAKVMTEANRAEVLPRFFHCSKQEAMQVAVDIVPAAVIPRKTVVTEIRPPVKSMTSPVHPGELSAPAPAAVTARDPARTVVEPLTSTMSRLHLTVSRVFVGKLRKARAGQSHVQPGAEDEQVLEAALDLLLAHQEKRRASVPPRVKREVRERDGGKCQWKLDSGGVCGSEVRLEIDHVVPRGRGGASTVENCRILCKAHNLEAARQVYGDAHMDLFTLGVPTVREPAVEWGAALAPAEAGAVNPPAAPARRGCGRGPRPTRGSRGPRPAARTQPSESPVPAQPSRDGAARPAPARPGPAPPAPGWERTSRSSAPATPGNGRRSSSRRPPRSPARWGS
jgi:5-methylcytosine-specific restriction endonuclease McrA